MYLKAEGGKVAFSRNQRYIFAAIFCCRVLLCVRWCFTARFSMDHQVLSSCFPFLIFMLAVLVVNSTVQESHHKPPHHHLGSFYAFWQVWCSPMLCSFGESFFKLFFRLFFKIFFSSGGLYPLGWWFLLWCLCPLICAPPTAVHHLHPLLGVCRPLDTRETFLP